jgi:oligopeptidase B
LCRAVTCGQGKRFVCEKLFGVTADLDDTAAPPLAPPVAERRPTVLSAHGDSRVDDWYWLRDRDDAGVLALLEAENAYTASVTAHLEPLVDQLYSDMLAKIQLTDVSYPSPRGAYAYYSRTVEGLEHPIFCRRPSGSPLPDADPGREDEWETVLLDENQMAAGLDYFSIGDTAVSPDQRLLAYAVDVSGGERMTVRIRDIEAGTDLADEIENAYYGLAFAGNGTLFYTRPDDAMRPHQIWRHRLGADPSSDVLVWQEDDEHFFLRVGSTKDEEYILLGAASNVTAEWRLVPTSTPESEPIVIEPRRQGVTYAVEHHRGEILVLSNDDALNFAVHRAPAANPSRPNWRVLLPHREDVRIDGIDVVDGYLLIEERGHATTAIRLVPLALGGGSDSGGSGGSGTLPGKVIEAPEAGVVFAADNPDFHATSIRFETTSLITPRTLHSYDLETARVQVLKRQPAPGYNPGKYLTERRWAKSVDGTEIPVTLAWAADRPGGPGPCLLNGYGSYEISTDPTYRVDRPIHPLLDRGFVYAIAHVRGGGEMGRRWYLDGKLANKTHSFEDFVAVGRYLVAEGLTSPEQLAAVGGSAGGLLMGASANLAPELFAGIIAEVPFVDCLTTMLDPTLPLTVIEQEEWGDPIADRDAYTLIKSYAPYDNVRPVRYPKILVTSGLNDPRVGFFEPTKWVQKLRAAHPDNPSRILLRMELVAGHSGPSGRYQAWKKRAFLLAFVLDAVSAPG